MPENDKFPKDMIVCTQEKWLENSRNDGRLDEFSVDEFWNSLKVLKYACHESVFGTLNRHHKK